MPIEIRPASMDDYAAMNTLMAQIDHQHRTQHPEVFREVIPARDRAFYAMWMNRRRRKLLVALQDGLVVGLVQFASYDAADIPFLKQRRYVHVDTLVVDENHARQGIGSALMAAVHDWARAEGIREVNLGVWAFNTDAIAFYEKQGYRTYLLRMAIDLSDSD